MTGQRRMIARVLSIAKDHPEVEELLPASTRPAMHAYRFPPSSTIKLFEANGFLERHDFGAGRGRYEETARRHHDHLIDLDSGRVMEFRNEEIETPAGAGGARPRGSNLVGHKLELVYWRTDGGRQAPRK